MENLNFNFNRIYDFVFDYAQNKLVIEDDLGTVGNYLSNVIKCYESNETDFVNYFSNYLYKIKNENDLLRFEKELVFDNKEVFFVVKARNYTRLSKLKGVLIDDTQNKILQQKVLQTEKLRSLGDLVGGIAHDLNNQLMVILGSCELIKNIDTSTKVKSYLACIEKSAYNNSALINKLLTFSHTEKFPKGEFNIVYCVTDVASVLRRIIKKQATILCDCFLEELVVLGNYALIQSVFLNICKNAIQAVSDDGVIVIKSTSVYLDQVPQNVIDKTLFEEGVYALVQIIDNGCGIPEEKISKIFDPFYTTKDVDKGSGLGLSTVLGTLEKHNAMIEVKSVLNEGTTFSLYFKVNKREALKVGINKKRIMIIDDEYLVRMIVKEMLVSLGYQVFDFEDGGSALNYYKLNYSNIDLIICDMIMPKLSGVEVLDKMLEINENVKFIILSGYSNEEFNINDKIFDYLKKPIKASILGEVVENALK